MAYILIARAGNVVIYHRVAIVDNTQAARIRMVIAQNKVICDGRLSAVTRGQWSITIANGVVFGTVAAGLIRTNFRLTLCLEKLCSTTEKRIRHM